MRPDLPKNYIYATNFIFLILIALHLKGEVVTSVEGAGGVAKSGFFQQPCPLLNPI